MSLLQSLQKILTNLFYLLWKETHHGYSSETARNSGRPEPAFTIRISTLKYPLPPYLSLIAAVACHMIISYVRHLDYWCWGPSCLNITQRRRGAHSAILSVTHVFRWGLWEGGASHRYGHYGWEGGVGEIQRIQSSACVCIREWEKRERCGWVSEQSGKEYRQLGFKKRGGKF